MADCEFGVGFSEGVKVGDEFFWFAVPDEGDVQLQFRHCDGGVGRWCEVAMVSWMAWWRGLILNSQ